jgi:hypothetical protein
LESLEDEDSLALSLEEESFDEDSLALESFEFASFELESFEPESFESLASLDEPSGFFASPELVLAA